MRTYQQVLFMTTTSESLRSDAIGWTIEDGSMDADKVQSNTGIDIGLIMSHKLGTALPKTVAHALRMGWKLLSYKPLSHCEVEYVMTREVNQFGDIPV